MVNSDCAAGNSRQSWHSALVSLGVSPGAAQGRLHLQSWIPASLHRLIYRLAHWGRRQVWTVLRPTVEGARVLAFDPQGRVLLIRLSYGSGNWVLPGGGMDPGESPVDAGVRELREETGCRLTGAREVMVLTEDLHGATNIVHLVAGRTEDEPAADGRETIDAGFFALDALPEPLVTGLAEALPDWVARSRQ